MSAIWYREETNYPDHPGKFVGSVITTNEPTVGLFTVVKGSKTLFSWRCRLPGESAKDKVVKTFQMDMSNLMDGAIELKDR